jgi:hypothetical protein
MMSNRPSQEVVERDIDFDAMLAVVRVCDRGEAADLLHAALRVAFNNGEAFGMASMHASHMRVLDQSIAAPERRKP